MLDNSNSLRLPQTQIQGVEYEHSSASSQQSIHTSNLSHSKTDGLTRNQDISASDKLGLNTSAAKSQTSMKYAQRKAIRESNIHSSASQSFNRSNFLKQQDIGDESVRSHQFGQDEPQINGSHDSITDGSRPVRKPDQMTTAPSANTDNRTSAVDILNEKGKKRLSDLSSANGETKGKNETSG